MPFNLAWRSRAADGIRAVRVLYCLFVVAEWAEGKERIGRDRAQPPQAAKKPKGASEARPLSDCPKPAQRRKRWKRLRTLLTLTRSPTILY